MKKFLTYILTAALLITALAVPAAAAEEAYAAVTDIYGVPGDLVTVCLTMEGVSGASVGVKYSLPEGVEFDSGSWLLEGGVLSNVAAFGAAYAWSEPQTIGGNVLMLNFRILPGAPASGTIPFEVVVKDLNTTVYTDSVSASLYVDYSVQGVALDCYSRNISVGGTTTLNVTTYPMGLEDQVIWYSSDENVATVENGKVTGIGAGTAWITAELDGYTANCTIYVQESTGRTGTKECLYTGQPGCVKHIRCILNSLMG